MTVTLVIGTQWGDEGKGKAIDVLASSYEYVARYNGGNNAGHTVINSQGTFKIHLVPSGIFYPNTVCLLGNGLVIDPSVMIEEITALQKAGINLENRLWISPRAHFIMPYHKILDELYEKAKGQSATGTTRRGIGPAFADKASYNGIRFGDAADSSYFLDKLNTQVLLKNKIVQALGGGLLDLQEIFKEYSSYYKILKPYIKECFPIVQEALKLKKKILLEQAQGTLLDPDFGIYPYVTGSTTLATAATAGLGIPPRSIDRIIGVAKAYTTRVGSGPLPSEMTQNIAALQEKGATTGRSRRIGWFDVEAVRLSIKLNGIDALFLTKLDTLSSLDTVPICTGYTLEGVKTSYIETPSFQWDKITPIYQNLPGWKEDISQIRHYQELPPQARNYVETLEKHLDCPIQWVSVGPSREALIERK